MSAMWMQCGRNVNVSHVNVKDGGEDQVQCSTPGRCASHKRTIEDQTLVLSQACFRA